MKNRLIKKLLSNKKNLTWFWKMFVVGKPFEVGYFSFTNQLSGRTRMINEIEKEIEKYLDNAPDHKKSLTATMEENLELKRKLKGHLKRSGRNFKWFWKDSILPVAGVTYQTFIGYLSGSNEIRPDVKELINKYCFDAVNNP